MDGRQSQENDGEDIVLQQIAAATNSTLPITSAPVYRTAWHDLQDFRSSLNLTGQTTAKHLFAFLARKHATKEWESPGTLWTRYSMLKTMLRIREGSLIDDGSTAACEAWLKSLSRTHCPKQSLQLTKEQVSDFLIKERDSAPIDLRVLLVFGLNLGLRTGDVKKLQWKNVTPCETGLRITVDWPTKTDQGGRGNWYFIAREENPHVCGVTLFTKYKSIVQEADPERLNGDLWLKVIKRKDGKWTVVSVRGRNWVSSAPSVVAKSLGLPNADQYTGHCFRRTSAQWQADAGATVLELQNQFGWKNPSMATVYTGQSVAARSASSRRCLLSTEAPLQEAATSSRHQESLQSAGSRQCSNQMSAHSSQQQVDLAAVGRSHQWPVSISGQTVNVYFGEPLAPLTTTSQIPASSSRIPLLQNEREVETDCQEAATSVNQYEKDILSDLSDTFGTFVTEDEMPPFVRTITNNEELLAPIAPNGSAVVCAKKRRAPKKPAVKKQRLGKTKVMPIEKLVLISPVEQDAALSASVGPIESTGRPIRIIKTTIHNNPYSKNVKGFVPPQNK